MTSAEPRHGFRITLDNFEGPFDLLLQLIGRHQLDIAEVALSQVTDEFIAYVKAGGEVWDLEQTSSFLVVAATLLDLKAARLLPSGDVDDPEDLAVLEARDLLFARLLQYRAYKRVSAWFADRMAAECLVHARPGGLEDQFRGLLPEVTIPGGVERLARLAERAFTRAEEPVMPLDQLHIPQVSVAEQADIVIGRLRQSRSMTFRALSGDANRLVTVARFLALLELFRLGQVGFNQLTPLGELTVRWAGEASGGLGISGEYDRPGPGPGGGRRWSTPASWWRGSCASGACRARPWSRRPRMPPCCRLPRPSSVRAARCRRRCAARSGRPATRGWRT